MMNNGGGVFIDVRGLANLIPAAVHLWDALTRKGAFALPANWETMEDGDKLNLLMAAVQESNRRETITSLGDTAPDVIKTLLGMLGGVGIGNGSNGGTPALPSPYALPAGNPALSQYEGKAVKETSSDFVFVVQGGRLMWLTQFNAQYPASSVITVPNGTLDNTFRAGRI